MSIRLGRFKECSGMLPTTKFAYWKGRGTCDALLCLSHTLRSALESGQKARIVQIYFSAAFDIVNHLGILYKLCSVGIGGSVLSILTQFLSNQSQHVMVGGCWSMVAIYHPSTIWWMVASGQCFGHVIVLPVHFGDFFDFGK